MSILTFCRVLVSMECYDNNFEPNLFRDLLLVEQINAKQNERLPVTYNHLLYGGYLNMPSARMGNEGEISIGYTYLPPYRMTNCRFQLTDSIEVSANYRLFKGVKDPVLSEFGFGDFSDKGANVKFSLFHPEDSSYNLPGLAIGFEDFLGTQSFESKYVVLTQVFLEKNLELSIGYAGGRIQGFFGGVNWMPFLYCNNPYLQQVSITAEYDATPYKDPDIEPHPKGRKKNSPINLGLKYRLFDLFDFSVSYVRGNTFSFSFSTFYNFGTTKGFIPKFRDPLLYRYPMVQEPIGLFRTHSDMVEDLVEAFSDQGFLIYEILQSSGHCGDYLIIHMENSTYRFESEVRKRLYSMLAYLIPENIKQVDVVIEIEGFPIQTYQFCMEYVRQYGECQLGQYELDILTPLYDPGCISRNSRSIIYNAKRNLWDFVIFPKFRTLFGSARGKIKYAVGINAGIEGYLWQDIYYSLLFGSIFSENMENLSDFDRLNPSQLINVRTDIVSYYHHSNFTIDEAFIQKNWNIKGPWFSKAAIGLFETQYGGIALETLCYPVNSNFAFGVEGAILKKRTFSGFCFTDKIRKLNGFNPTFQHFTGSQAFVDLYYHWEWANLNFKLKSGKFLANDWGTRFEVTRYFPSGLRLNFWYTRTNGHDKINGRTYYDKGIGFSLPLDLFYTYSSKKRWGYGMSAWLRDVGVSASTGIDLYDLIHDQR